MASEQVGDKENGKESDSMYGYGVSILFCCKKKRDLRL